MEWRGRRHIRGFRVAAIGWPETNSSREVGGEDACIANFRLREGGVEFERYAFVSWFT